MSKFNVGDTVILVHPNYGRGPSKTSTHVIAKTGRKYAYIEDAGRIGDIPFDLNDGVEHRRGDYQNYLNRIFLPSEWDAHNRGLAVDQALRERHNLGPRQVRWKQSPEVLEKLLAFLDEQESHEHG